MKGNKTLVPGLTLSLLRSILPVFSLIFTLLGGTLFLVGCGANGFNWSALSNVQIQQMEYVESAEKNVTDINLNFDSTDFLVMLDDNAESVSVSYPQRQNKKGKNISEIPRVSLKRIPALATGTVVPPNREFLAMLGDNKNETEVVSPLSTMKQAMMEALAESGGGGGDITLHLYLNGRKMAVEVVKEINNMTREAGKPVLLF